MGLTRYPPLPTRDDWAPSYLSGRPGASNRDFAFRFSDPEGCYPRPPGYHGAVDWFAPAGTPVRAPWAGTVTRAVRNADSSGAVFGGVVEVTEATGLVWVMRHVQPRLPLGSEVDAGDVVAEVAAWTGGATHLHLECWRSKSGGYAIANMLDPADFVWEATAPVAEPVARFYMEELPHTAGGRGPAVVASFSDADSAKAEKQAASLRKSGTPASTVRGEDDRVYVLTWAPGTYGDRFRWGPWAVEGHRDEVLREREQIQGRSMRPFRGRGASLYPWPKES